MEPLWKCQESLTKFAKFGRLPRTILYKSRLSYPSWQTTSIERPPSWVAFLEGFDCIFTVQKLQCSKQWLWRRTGENTENEKGFYICLIRRSQSLIQYIIQGYMNELYKHFRDSLRSTFLALIITPIQRATFLYLHSKYIRSFQLNVVFTWSWPPGKVRSSFFSHICIIQSSTVITRSNLWRY